MNPDVDLLDKWGVLPFLPFTERREGHLYSGCVWGLLQSQRNKQAERQRQCLPPIKAHSAAEPRTPEPNRQPGTQWIVHSCLTSDPTVCCFASKSNFTFKKPSVSSLEEMLLSWVPCLSHMTQQRHQMDVEAGMDGLSLVTHMLVVEEFAAELFRKNFFF